MRALLLSLAASAALAQNPPAAQAPANPPQGAAQGAGQGGRGNAAGPRPYDQVITARARTEQGVIAVHHVGDRWFFEVPDSATKREFLFVSRIAALPEGQTGGFPGSSEDERVIKFERVGDRVMVRSQSYRAVADDSLSGLNVDAAGLDEMDIKILETLIHKFRGGPVGLNTLAVAVAEEAETLEEIYEPYLIQEGFLDRTPRGRSATPRAHKHLGVIESHANPGRLL